jgi:hypothetical protein
MILLCKIVSDKMRVHTVDLSKLYETEIKNNSKIRNQYVWVKSTQYVSKYMILRFFM